MELLMYVFGMVLGSFCTGVYLWASRAPQSEVDFWRDCCVQGDKKYLELSAKYTNLLYAVQKLGGIVD